ncbi:DUF3606 domain-containing protein [Pseudacidovorax intermedius]|uniref:DUF3606 domain-containing protein n=1 Tax=Pseudacidovorax intermedius TaxID=433924 RepID=A0A147GND8_9BURK|nr:DUF3606 domain-containing protein [Pseudacidovorax intermedius]KTT14986.1 hypothetical protein NS331_21945 [Pseudacidovorax intermedius]
MADNPSTNDASNASGVDRIDVKSDEALAQWGKKLDVTAAQLKEAVAAVGDKAPDVEMHLKGTRASTNDDQIEKAGGA